MEIKNETVAEVCAELKEVANGQNVSNDGLVVEISQEEIWDACGRIEAAHKREVAELRECLRIIRDNLVLHTIKSADGKYVNKGAFLSKEFVDDERWRKALEGEK